MDDPAPQHVLNFYRTHFRPGMVDLSSSSPVAPTGASVPADYPTPGGMLALRQAVAALYPGLGPENVVVTNGASEALAAAALTFVEQGQRVHLHNGTYPTFSEIARRLGADVSHGDALPGDARLAVANNPSVPDGRLLDTRDLAEELDRRDGRLICDEVYLDLRPLGPALPAVAHSKRAISIGDISKPLGLGGLRIGWAASHDRDAIGAITQNVQLLTGGPSTPAMALAAEAVANYPDRFAANASVAARNGPQVFAALAEAGWTFRPPGMGWTFVASPPEPLPAERARALEDAGVFLVPAAAFGLAGGGYRVSVFAPIGALRQALALASADRPRDEVLVVLAKAPSLSKTRLASQIGPPGAQRLARAMLDDTLSLAAESGHRLVVAYTPAGSLAEFSSPALGATFVSQPDGDLGARIESALGAALQSGAAAVLIGTDTPHLPPGLLDTAFAAVRHHNLVLGPAADGGFYLIGLAPGVFPGGLFDRVAWSTDSVFERVSANARRLGLAVANLPCLTDVDDLASLRAVVETEREASSAVRTAAVASSQLGVAP